MQSWQMLEAQRRFTDLIDCAQTDGPQEIKDQGQSVAVLVSREWFDQQMKSLEELELLPIVHQRLAQWTQNPELVIAMSHQELQILASNPTSTCVSNKH